MEIEIACQPDQSNTTDNIANYEDWTRATGQFDRKFRLNLPFTSVFTLSENAVVDRAGMVWTVQWGGDAKCHLGWGRS